MCRERRPDLLHPPGEGPTLRRRLSGAASAHLGSKEPSGLSSQPSDVQPKLPLAGILLPGALQVHREQWDVVPKMRRSPPEGGRELGWPREQRACRTLAGGRRAHARCRDKAGREESHRRGGMEPIPPRHALPGRRSFRPRGFASPSSRAWKHLSGKAAKHFISFYIILEELEKPRHTSAAIWARRWPRLPPERDPPEPAASVPG